MRAFSLLFAWISLVFKVVTFAVIWKVSINFRQIVKKREFRGSSTVGSDLEVQGPNSARDVDDIIAQF